MSNQQFNLTEQMAAARENTVVIDWSEAIRNIKLIYVQFIKKINMYKVVSECNHLEVWASGFYSKEKAQNSIDAGYFHQYMYDADKHKKLIVVSY